MTASAFDLARELAQLQQDYRAYAQTADFAQLTLASPGGFLETYRQRTAEIQKAICRLRPEKTAG